MIGRAIESQLREYFQQSHLSNDEGNVEFLEVYCLGNQLMADEHVVTGTAKIDEFSDVNDDVIMISLRNIPLLYHCAVFHVIHSVLNIYGYL